jgi:hypothetical protein
MRRARPEIHVGPPCTATGAVLVFAPMAFLPGKVLSFASSASALLALFLLRR